MSQNKYNLCKNNEEYRKLFDEIAGNANFGMWKTKKKQNLPKWINPNVKILKPRGNMGKKEDDQKVVSALNEVQKSSGVGDDIEKILSKFGITKGLLQSVLKRTCGCDRRKKLMNKLMPYTKEK